MKEYIEREAALKNQRWNGRLDEYVVFVKDIEAIPAADVVEARHGRWIKIEGLSSDYYCSECNQKWWTPFPEEMHYCPNCGAKMDEVGNGRV